MKLDLKNVDKMSCQQYAGEWDCKVLREKTDDPPASFLDWELQFKQKPKDKYHTAAYINNANNVKIHNGLIKDVEINKNSIDISFDKDIDVVIEYSVLRKQK